MRCRALGPALFALFLVACASGPIVVSRPAGEAGEEGIPYSLPMTLVKVETTTTKDASGNYAVTLTVTAALAPDPDTRLLLVHQKDVLHTDDVKIDMSSSGLLTGVNATSTDQTGAFVKSVAEAVLTLQGTLGANNAKPTMQQLDPLLGSRTVTLPLSGLPPIYDLGNKTRLAFQIDGRSPDEAPGRIRPEFREAPGILVRVPQARTVTVRLEYPALKAILAVSSIGLAAPDFSPWYVVPLERAALVEAKHVLQLQDGMLTSAQTMRPSSALAVIAVPIDVGKAVLSVPGELFKLRYDSATREHELLTKEKELDALRSERELADLRAEQELEKARIENELEILRKDRDRLEQEIRELKGQEE